MGEAPNKSGARRRWRRPISEAAVRRVIAAAVALSAIALTAGSSPASPKAAGAPPIVTPIAVSVLNPPDPVLGADNRNHLVYELKIANLGRTNEVTVDSVQLLVRGKPFGPPLEGKNLAAVFRPDDFEPQTTTMQPGLGATILMDVTYGAKQRTPPVLTHRFVLTVRDLSGVQPTTTVSFTGVRTPVHQRKAIEIASPLRGPRWLAANGCCAQITPHRNATLPIDGTIHTPERFAIDFVQLDAQYRLFTGPKDELSSYAFYGAPVHAVATGKVVGVQDGLPDQTPGSFPPHPTIQEAGGNYVVQRIASGRYAFYAHLQPGTLRVEKGDRIRTGQVIGLLGSSGNSDAPHLHFHVMDTPSPLLSNGLPFRFKSFRGQGVVLDEAPLFVGDPAPVDPERLAGRHRGQMPLNDQLVDFG